VAEISARDQKDSTRENSPLCKAFDAEEIDTTALSFDEQVDFIINKAASFMKSKSKTARQQ
jgi:cytidylate kinase